MDGATAAGSESANDLDTQRRNYTRALVSEIRLLVRTIANDPATRISDVRLSYKLPGEPHVRELSASEIIDEVSGIEDGIAEQTGIGPIGFLQLVRDALVAKTAPATGLTIAYTRLVAGEERSQPSESGYVLAEEAYGLLPPRAKWHRRLAYGLTFFAVLFTIFAAWEATKASLGKSLLQNLDLLQSEQAVLSAEKLKLENTLEWSAENPAFAAAGGGPLSVISLQAVPLCDRYRLREAMLSETSRPLPATLRDLRLEASPAERDLCGRDTILARNLAIARSNLHQYQQSWPGFAGGVISIGGEILSHIGLFSPTMSPPGCMQGTKADPGELDDKSLPCSDVEYIVSPIVQVTTNYILPITFGFLGSLLYILLDHFKKLQTNTLSPRDFPLIWLRLIIGLVVAACVSLLVSSSASPGTAAAGASSGGPVAGALVASLISSASGITFLAGFGAEAVVTLLQSLVGRVFAAPK